MFMTKTNPTTPETSDQYPDLPGANWPAEWSAKKAKARSESNWQNIADVDWEDLEFYLEKARRKPNKDDFATAGRILAALQRQLLERK
jgi:hypothetical protein